MIVGLGLPDLQLRQQGDLQLCQLDNGQCTATGILCSCSDRQVYFALPAWQRYEKWHERWVGLGKLTAHQSCKHTYVPQKGQSWRFLDPWQIIATHS